MKYPQLMVSRYCNKIADANLIYRKNIKRSYLTPNLSREVFDTKLVALRLRSLSNFSFVKGLQKFDSLYGCRTVPDSHRIPHIIIIYFYIFNYFKSYDYHIVNSKLIFFINILRLLS